MDLKLLDNTPLKNNITRPENRTQGWKTLVDENSLHLSNIVKRFTPEITLYFPIQKLGLDLNSLDLNLNLGLHNLF